MATDDGSSLIGFAPSRSGEQTGAEPTHQNVACAFYDSQADLWEDIIFGD